MKKKSIKLLLCALISSSSYVLADTFIENRPNKSYTNTKIGVTPLTPFDEAFQREIAKYPKDTTFFVDGRTGKILSTNQTPKVPNQSPNPPGEPPRNSAYVPNSPAPAYPTYQMQETRIELLQ
ncbi:MAG: hypothetical protein J1E31_02095 [Helicobacter sp.]|nr:hypothetical protein [Helicobacter sp.]